MDGLTMHPRQEAHIEALKMIRQDQFLNALVVLKESQKNYGFNTLNLVEVASCYYMLNDYDNFKKTSLVIEKEFKKAESQLSPRQHILTCLGYGKLLEECGQFTEALEFYNRPFKKMTDDQIDAADLVHLKKLTVQKLRLKHQWNLSKDLQKDYFEVDAYKSDNINYTIEREHALMLSECQIYGLNQAFTRYESSIKNLKLKKSDYRLFTMDLIFEFHLKNEPTSCFSSYLKQIDYFDCDPFEKAIFDITLNKDVDISISEGLSIPSSVRILSLIYAHQKNKSDLAYTKLMLLVQNLNPKNKKIILAKLKLDENLNAQVIYFNERSLELKSNLGSLSIKSNSFTHSLINLFSHKSEISVDEAIEYCFQISVDEYSLERLRTAVRRSSSQISKSLGLQEAFILTKSSLKVSDIIKIKAG